MFQNPFRYMERPEIDKDECCELQRAAKARTTTTNTLLLPITPCLTPDSPYDLILLRLMQNDCKHRK